MLKVIICGDRAWKNYNSVFEIIKGLVKNYGQVVVIQGECPVGGADEHAKRAAKELEIPCICHPAKWTERGKAAGPIRNQEMIDYWQPQMCIAFHSFIPKSKGTKDMVERARKAGIETYIVDK